MALKDWKKKSVTTNRTVFEKGFKIVEVLKGYKGYYVLITNYEAKSPPTRKFKTKASARKFAKSYMRKN